MTQKKYISKLQAIKEKELSRFQIDMNNLISKAKYVIQRLPDKGDKESDSQKICLINALNELEYTVNGVEMEDFI